MRYKRIRIDATENTYEKACMILIECGINAYEVIDDKPVDNPYEWEYEELRPDIEDMNGITSVIFYVEETEDETFVIERLKKELPDISIYTDVSDEEDWRDKWKDYFHSFTIGDILIKPSWEDAADDGSPIVIEIDPGISFGTGAHETTRMCIEALSKTGLHGKDVIDAGCGSGILAIAAYKLGAGHVTCLDIDPDCIVTSKENIKKNACDKRRFSFFCGDIKQSEDLGVYDVMVANILADIIVDMLPGSIPRVKRGGVYIFSGIIEGKQDKVIKTMESLGIRDIRVKNDGEWYMITGKR